ncbi:MAG: HAMP domain-containing sensor histidine kinase [Potamolinea sp.]
MQKSEVLRHLPLSAVSFSDKLRVDELLTLSLEQRNLKQPGVKPAQPPEVIISSVSSLDIETICQRHIQQIITQLSIFAVWIVYRDRPDQQRQCISQFSGNRDNLSPAILSYLESEEWLKETPQARKLTQLPFPPQYSTNKTGNAKVAKQKIGEQQHPNFFAYIYPLGQEEKTDEYLLLWTEKPLSPPQQQHTEQQAQLLHDYLTIALNSSRQQEEIQLLEQVLRRGEHQLRNSLSLIGLYAENLGLALPDDQLKEQALIIRETVKKVSSNLTNLLACSQQAKMHVYFHDLRDILVETIKILQPKLDEKKLLIHYPDKSITLNVDGLQIQQVFENLLSNAIDFSPEGGVITCNWQVFCNEVLVEISDQGLGLSQEDLKDAFTPFYSKRSGGTGIGLTIAKKIILDHQGHIWGQNLTLGGAQFSFILPRKISHHSNSTDSLYIQPFNC